MDVKFDPGLVADPLPRVDRFMRDPRVRPICLVAGFTLVLVGALVQLPPVTSFWATAVSGVLLLFGVPLFSIGLAAAEPEGENDPFRLGIDLRVRQRRIVAIGSFLVMLCPLLLGVLIPVVGFTDVVRFAVAIVAFVGSILILTGFLAWTSRTMVETTASP